MATFTFTTQQPSSALEPFIHFYFQQQCRDDGSDTTHQGQQITLPTGCTFIGFVFAAPILFDVWDQSTLRVDYPVFFSGQFDRLYSMKFLGNADMLGVVLRPTAAHRLTSMPISEMCNQTIEADYHVDKSLNELHERMAEVSFSGRIRQFEQWFLARMARTEQHAVFTDWAVETIIRYRGIITTQALAQELRVSQRHLQRSFKERIGLCPHQYANILKLIYLVSELNRGGASSD